jgi:hypothetical protein
MKKKSTKSSPTRKAVAARALPDGEAGVTLLARHSQALEFITSAYRHGKSLLELGASKPVLDRLLVKAIPAWCYLEPATSTPPRQRSSRQSPGTATRRVNALSRRAEAFR